jgi:hypothetical protein
MSLSQAGTLTGVNYLATDNAPLVPHLTPAKRHRSRARGWVGHYGLVR